MLRQVRRVEAAGRALRVRERHDEHVAALLERLPFVVAVRVAGSVGVVRAEVVHAVRVGVLAGLLVLEERVEEELEERWVRVGEHGVEGENDIDRLDVTVG